MRLLDSLEKLNISYKNKDNEFMGHVTDFQKENAFSMSKTDISIFQISEFSKREINNNIKKQNSTEISRMQNTKISDISENSYNFINCDNTLTTSFSCFSEIDNIITKNIDFSDEVLKLLVIGDKMAGKTTFVNNVLQLNKQIEERKIDSNYIPTQG